MNDSARVPFGLIIAYLLPGFIGLVGVAGVFPSVAEWLQPVNIAGSGVGPAVYTVLAAMAIGMIVSCVRWLVLDHLLEWTGTVPPVWNDSALDENLTAFNYLVEAHYRYYQFYGNSLVAIAGLCVLNRSSGELAFLSGGTGLVVLILCAVLLAGARDALAKYYKRTSRLIGVITDKHSTGAAMTNGNHHAQEAGATAQSKPSVKTTDKPAAPAKPQQTVANSGSPQK